MGGLCSGAQHAGLCRSVCSATPLPPSYPQPMRSTSSIVTHPSCTRACTASTAGLISQVRAQALPGRIKQQRHVRRRLLHEAAAGLSALHQGLHSCWCACDARTHPSLASSLSTRASCLKASPRPPTPPVPPARCALVRTPPLHHPPCAGTGSPRKVGAGAGEGFNVNVGWDGPGVEDGDYMAAFKWVVTR